MSLAVLGLPVSQVEGRPDDESQTSGCECPSLLLLVSEEQHRGAEERSHAPRQGDHPRHRLGDCDFPLHAAHVSGATTAFSRLRFPVEPAGRARGVGCSRDGGCYAASGGAPASIPPQTRFARGEPGLKRPGGGCGPRPTRRRSSHSRIASWRRFARSRTRRRSRSGVGRDRVPGSSHHRDALPAPGYFGSGARRKRSPAATRALRARPRRRRGGLEARPRRRDPPCPCPGTR